MTVHDRTRLTGQLSFFDILKVVYIRFIGTHAQYDKIDAQTI